MTTNTIIRGNARSVLADLPSQSVDCVITSPPYFRLRNYGHSNQLGLEATPQEWGRQPAGRLRRTLPRAETFGFDLAESR